VAALVDTNVLVCRFDPRFPGKQPRAAALLRAGIADDSIRVPHEALVEFLAAATKPLDRRGSSLLSPHDGRREMDEMLVQFEVLYPDEELVRVAIRGAATYDLRRSTRTCGRTPSASASRPPAPRADWIS
jgi:predicted nucleic acid-binding protein